MSAVCTSIVAALLLKVSNPGARPVPSNTGINLIGSDSVCPPSLALRRGARHRQYRVFAAAIVAVSPLTIGGSF
jgi:hypothetical protein